MIVSSLLSSGEKGQLITRFFSWGSLAEHRTGRFQISSLSQICSSSLSPFVTLKLLDIHHPRQNWQDDMENEKWLELLQPFTSEGSGPKQAMGPTCRSCLARTCRGKDNRSVTRVKKHILLGATAVWTCQGGDPEVHCRATALGSSRGSLHRL